MLSNVGDYNLFMSICYNLRMLIIIIANLMMICYYPNIITDPKILSTNK